MMIKYKSNATTTTKKMERLLTKLEVGSLKRVIKDKLLGKLRGKDNKRKWHYESILYQKNWRQN